MLWSHLPDDRDFSDASYTHLALFRTVEDVVCLMSQLPAKLVENCMFFVMRQGIKPLANCQVFFELKIVMFKKYI